MLQFIHVQPVSYANDKPSKVNIMDHLSALQLRLSNERIRLNQATNKDEIALRSVWVKQMEKEVQGEIEFLNQCDDLTADELLKELLG